jgi:hypothetical protein
MAHLDASGEDFLGAEVPKSFVAKLLSVAESEGRIDEGRSTPERYRMRVLYDDAAEDGT